jgi:anaphase-promoting complex subunit 1
VFLICCITLQVCGLALGMVNLSRGASTVSGLEDLHIEERLHRFISGGTIDSESNGRKEYFGVGGQGEVDRNARIYEANSLNRDITAPGATLAIGLMYIRSQ